MDPQFTPIEQYSSNGPHYPGGTSTIARLSTQNTTVDDSSYVDELETHKKSQITFFPCLKPMIAQIIMLAVFASVSMIVAVLIVCFTAPKPNKTCQMTFQRTMKSSIAYSSQPRSVALGDLNNDNKMDIVVVNSGTNTIGIFLSNVNGSFGIQRTYSTGSQSRPYSVVISDFNIDNYRDIAVANYGTNNIGIFMAYGNGTYDSQKIISTGSFRPWFISTGDFNRDNQSDIAVVYYGTANIGILLGTGHGSFHNPIFYSTGYDSLPYSLVTQDLNKDNYLDIAVANYGTNNIGIFWGYGNGTFANQKIYTTTRNSNPSSIAVGDFNNDQQLDIVVTNYGLGSIGIFLNHGNGTFGTQISYEIDSMSRPQFIDVGYFNKDNYLDVVVVDSENDQIHILPSYGNGSFATLTTYDSITGSQPFSIGVTDFDNDNQSDIAVVNYGTNNVLVLSGYSSKPSARQQAYLIAPDSRPTEVVTFDFNNDGQLDIAVNNFNDNYILILLGTGSGSFVRGATYSTGDNSAPQYLCLGDLNNDKRMDIVTANTGGDSVGVLLGQDNGTFASVMTYSTGTGSAPWVAAVGDFNNDSYLDIVSANTGLSSIGIFLGYGDGTFTDMKTYSTGSYSVPYFAAVGDVNNDNHLDIVVVNLVPNRFGVFLGNGDGTFGILTTYSAGINDTSAMAILADLNRDTYLDVVSVFLDVSLISINFGEGDGTFNNKISYLPSDGATSAYICVADFNNDGNYDIAAPNFDTNNIVIYFGSGNGSFEIARTYSTGNGSSPFAIAVADLNNDGNLELIVAYWGSGYVAVLTQYDAAEFVDQIFYPTGSALHPYSLAIGDFNNDNQSDVVVANSGTDNLGILLGWNNGTFAAQIIYPIGTDSYPQYVITGDVNKDKNLDIIVVNSKSNTISVIFGYGNETFASQLIYTTGDGSNPYAVAMSDFNNDDRYDLVVVNEGVDSIGIFLGFNYTSFQNQKAYSVENSLSPYGIVVNDFNNDNYLDIAVVFQGSNNLAILLGQGDGSFVLLITYSTGSGSYPYILVAHDVNNDGQLDILVANGETNTIGIFLGYGNGSFASMMTYSTGNGSSPHFLDVGDFNNDNQTDIVSANYGNNNIGILLGNGHGNFTLTNKYSTGDFSQPNSVAVGDLNNDGHLDIAVVNYGTNTIGVFIGYGDATFKSQVTYSTGYQSWPFFITISDFNNDNHSDIAVADYNSQYVSIFLGFGNGSFPNVTLYSSGDGSGPTSLSVGDFNNDNILDIAVANNAINNIVVLFGFGDGTFLMGTAYSTGAGSLPQSIAVGDFNNDRQLDIVVTNPQSNNIGVFIGYGREPFAGVTIYATGDGSQPHSVAVGDFNNDGWSDIVVTNYGTDNIGILLGNRDALFSPMIPYSTGDGSAPYSVAVGDFNKDSQSDIVVTNSNTDNVVIFRGYGNGSFTIEAMYSTGTRSRPYAVAIGDFNNDKVLDIVIANSGTSNIFLLYGYGNGTFGNTISYPLGYNFLPYSVAVTDLNRDNWMDIVIACYGTDNIETLVKMC